MNHRTISRAIAMIFIVAFLYTGTTKVLAYREFLDQINQSPILKQGFAPIAWIVPGMELILVILLMRSNYRLMAFYLTFIAMLAFTGYSIALATYPYFIPCGCGGFLERMPVPVHIMFDVLLLSLAVTGIYFQRRLRRGLP